MEKQYSYIDMNSKFKGGGNVYLEQGLPQAVKGYTVFTMDNISNLQNVEM
jgi:hypothetical protein